LAIQNCDFLHCYFLTGIKCKVGKRDVLSADLVVHRVLDAKYGSVI